MTYHIYVSGRVQGVGYRRFAQKSAEAMVLIGWTRNVWDGRVEVMVSGAQQMLEEYCEVLRKGPAFSQVHDMVVKTVTEDVSNSGFVILPDLEIK